MIAAVYEIIQKGYATEKNAKFAKIFLKECIDMRLNVSIIWTNLLKRQNNGLISFNGY